MSTNNKVRTKIEIANIEFEATINMVLYEFKYETVISIDVKLSALNSNKPSSYYYLTSSDIVKWPILKSPEEYSHHS